MKCSLLAFLLVCRLFVCSALLVKKGPSDSNALSQLDVALAELDVRGVAAGLLSPATTLVPSPSTVSARWKMEHGVGVKHNVVYTVDSAVFDALLRSMQSLALHSLKPEQDLIHLIVPKKDLAKASDLSRCFNSSLSHALRHVPQVIIHEAHQASFSTDYKDRSDLRGHASAFTRLFLPEYLPDVRRVVYIDADTLVMGDLTPLFEMPMQHALAAVREATTFQDLWGKWYPDLEKQVPDAKQHSIFNDGVMILDLEQWREQDIVQDLTNWALQSSASVDDQLLLNLEFQVAKNFDELPEEWNDFRIRTTGWPDYGWSDDLAPEDPISHAKIIHWTGPKPWNMEFREQWLKQYHHLWQPANVSITNLGCESSSVI
mmetsp:Transcript_99982/g.158253  ORF Transcript_99982/g.158253 Transcript_99982/m.158253 type:complete len:374 (-) Transcript_99982:166-1287(-)